MRALLIRFLNAVTKEDYKLLDVEYSNQRDLVSVLRGRIEELNSQIVELRLEKKSLQEILYKKAGLISNPESNEPLQDTIPIRASSKNWNRLRHELEADDRRRVNAEKETKDASV